MKELKEYAASELRDAYYDKLREESETKSNTLPKEYYPYEHVDKITLFDIESGDKNLYKVYVNDGCEGFEYLISVHGSGNFTYELLKETIRHEIVSGAIEGGYDILIEDIQLEKIGRYGLSMLDINVPEDYDEYEED